jgi:peptidoglycan/xylan/chitin deacetylase (PgdA/CDA1 family)
VNPLRAAARRIGLRRQHLRAIRVFGERTALPAWRRRRGAGPGRGGRSCAAGRVLCYHSVGSPAWSHHDVSPSRFRRHLELALREGYRFVPAGAIAVTGGEPGDLALTFDDGLRSVVENAAPVLAELGIPWTLFPVTAWSSGEEAGPGRLFCDWDDVRRIAARGGVEIGSHSVTHPNFAQLDTDAALRELVESRRALEVGAGVVTDVFAVPYGQARDWPVAWTALAREAGYRTIYANAPDCVLRTSITGFDRDRIFLAALEGVFDHEPAAGR